MATLQKIRNKAGLLIGVLGVALLFFILGEFLNSGTALFNKSKDRAFTVDGTVVSTADYNNRVQQMLEFEKMRTNRSSLEENEQAQITEQVYRQMVKEMILDDLASTLGLVVTVPEIDDLVQGQNISPILFQLFGNPQTGQFNKAALDNYLRMVHTDPNTLETDDQKVQLQQMKMQWAIIERMITYQRLEEKYASLMAGALIVNDVEAKANFDSSKRSANIAYVMQPYSVIADSTITVSDDEIKELYEKKKNNFKTQSELRRISYFVKDILPSAEDNAEAEKLVAVVKEQLQTTENTSLVAADYSTTPYLDAFVPVSSLPADAQTFVQGAAIGDIQGPVKKGETYVLSKIVDKAVKADSIKLQAINIQEGIDKAQNEAFVDSIITVIKGGKDFAAVAAEVMGNPNAGVAEWLTEADLAQNNLGKDFITSVFSTPSGEITKIYNRGVIQIVKIVEKTQPVSQVKFAEIVIPITISDKTINIVDSELASFISQNGTAENFVNGANEKGYNIITDVIVNPAENTLAGISGSRKVVTWAYNEKIGSVKNFDVANNKQRVVALITHEIKEGHISYKEKEIYDMLKTEVIKDKKAEKMIADIKAKPSTSLDGYAQSLSSKVDTVKFVNFNSTSLQGVGREPIINVYAELGKVNTLAGPLKGDRGVYVLNVLSAEDSSVQYDANLTKSQMQGAYQNLPRYIVESLYPAMEVKDNRVKVFREDRE